MSERQYFSLRYVVPGYSFILCIIAINYVPLLRILEITRASEAFGAFLAFLSLLAGSAIGFLISQFWWLYLHYHPLLGKDDMLPLAEEIYKKFIGAANEKEEVIKRKTKEKIHDIGRIYEWIIREDFVKQDTQGKNDGWRDMRGGTFSGFAERRWDMYNLLSSTKCAFGIGVLTGLIWRFYFHVTLSGATFLATKHEGGALFLFFVSLGVLLMVLRNAPKRLLEQYAPLAKASALARMSHLTRDELKQVFPDVVQ